MNSEICFDACCNIYGKSSSTFWGIFIKIPKLIPRVATVLASLAAVHARLASLAAVHARLASLAGVHARLATITHGWKALFDVKVLVPGFRGLEVVINALDFLQHIG